MTLADAIAKAHILNEEKLAAGIPIPKFNADAELHLAAFNRFCSQHGVRNCPARPQVVAAFIRAEEKFGTEPQTIALILSAIELLHDQSGRHGRRACRAGEGSKDRPAQVVARTGEAFIRDVASRDKGSGGHA
jgi:hypothetical protein